MEITSLLERMRQSHADILGDCLVGIYVHGSLALGCFRWDASDVDYLVVVDRPLSLETKLSLMHAITALNAEGPPKGLEMSVVQREHCVRFVHPMPFELHFSAMHLAWWQSNPREYCARMQGEDYDLAAHCTVIRHAGVVLCGEPIQHVFGPVPRAQYLDSILRDVQNATEDILANPVYMTLNLCRVAAAVEDGQILSKAQGGRWGLAHVDASHHGIIGAALEAYGKGKSITVEPACAYRFCKEMAARITRAHCMRE